MIQNGNIERLNRCISDFVKEYEDVEVSVLCKRYGINEKAKNHLNNLVNKMLLESNTNIVEAINADEKLSIKTIKLDKYGGLKESMSFSAFKYVDLVEEDWKSSSLRNMFSENVFVFTVFQNIDKELYLKQIRLWKMNEETLDSGVFDVWKRTKECVQNGNIVKYIDDRGRFFSYFPSSTDSRFVHVRPHARNRDDTFPLPVPDKYTGLTDYPKHSFWLNKSYVLKVISGREN